MKKKEYKEPVLKVIELGNIDNILLQGSGELGYSIDLDEYEEIETVNNRIWGR